MWIVPLLVLTLTFKGVISSDQRSSDDITNNLELTNPASRDLGRNDVQLMLIVNKIKEHISEMFNQKSKDEARYNINIMEKLLLLEERQRNQCKESDLKVLASYGKTDSNMDALNTYRQLIELQGEVKMEKEKRSFENEQFEILLNDLKTIVNSQALQIDQLKQNASDAERHIQALLTSNKHQKQEIEQHTANISELKQQQVVLNTLATNQQFQETALSSLNATTQHLVANSECKSRKVAFSAALSQSQTVTGGVTVVFDTVLNNIGGAYDKTTGVFESPVSGLYTFFVTANSQSTKYIRLDIFRNSTVVYHTLYSSGLNHNTITRNVILDLPKRTTVRVKSNGATSYLYTEAGKAWTTFSGHLLYQQEDNCSAV